MTIKTSFLMTLMAVSLVAGSAMAAKLVLYENTDLGLKISLPRGVAVETAAAGDDQSVVASPGKMKLKIVVRKGERIPQSQHQFRLMSYFAGEWQMAEEECRGGGWETCRSWNWDSEDGSRKGVAMVGYGPGGTYIVVLHGPVASFKVDRRVMRTIQDSLQLF